MNQGRQMGWTDERIALLTRYWQEGRSAAQIAEALGEGLTRNAVIGKAHRLGLASRPQAVKGGDGAAPAEPAASRRDRKTAEAPSAERAPEAASEAGAALPRETPEAPPAPAAAPVPAPLLPARKQARPAPKSTRVTLLDLNDRICKWPIGHPDEPDFHFCGKPVAPGFPYCSEHCLIAYQSQLPRRDRPAGPPPPFRPNLPRVR